MAILSNLSTNFCSETEVRERTNRQIQKTSLRIACIQQQILVLQKELKEKNVLLVKLKKTFNGEATIGLFERVQSGLLWYGDKELIAVGTKFFLAGIPCLSTGKENLLRSHIRRVLSERDMRNFMLSQENYSAPVGTSSMRELGRLPRSFTPRTVLIEPSSSRPIAPLELSVQVCSENITPSTDRYVNPTSVDTGRTPRVVSLSGGINSTSQESLLESSTTDLKGSSEVVAEVAGMPSAPEAQKDAFLPIFSLEKQWRQNKDAAQRSAEQLLLKNTVSNMSLSTNSPRLGLGLSISEISAKSEHFRAQPGANPSLSAKRGSWKRPFSPMIHSPHDRAAIEVNYFRSLERNDLPGVKSALDLGVMVETRNAQSDTGLILAAMNGYLEIVKCLLEVGSTGHVNLANDDGFTALQWAAKNGSKEIVVCLLESKADINARNKFHQSPLMLAGRYGHCDVVQVLLRHGCEIDRRDRNGRNVLMMAARNGHVMVVEALLEENISVNLIDFRGKTALILMAENACPKTIRGLKLLLQQGADARIDDDDGFCALDYLGKRVKTGAVPLNDDVRSIAMQMRRTFERRDSVVDFRLLPLTMDS